ncbi:MAG TPA: NCS2 family permease [Thermomicrobiales bacterium]|nr:NCS2 family permease [Thermomicrobiales bacterium]
MATAQAQGGWFDNQFRMSERGTNIRTELMAGLTTFMVMSYIIAVNPAILSFNGELSVTQVATVTCLVAGVMTILMGLYANIAIAIAPGLGLNAIVAFTLVGSMGLTFPQAMGVVVAEGIIITILVLTGVRRYVMDVVPMALKQAISVGIGFFILFIGLRNAGLVTFISGTDAPVGTTTGLLELTPLDTWPIFVVMVGLLVTIAFIARGHQAALLLGIIAATVTAFVVDVAEWPAEPMGGPDFELLGNFSFGFIGELGVLTALLVVLSLMLADFFDTMGTLIGVGSQAGYLDERGNLPNAQKPLLVDSLAAVAGGAASSSSATSYIESSAGVGVGGRTGLVSVTTGVLFLLALPFVELVNAIPGVATAPALIVVGVLMVGVLGSEAVSSAADSAWERRGINFSDVEESLPVVMTMLIMPLTFNITNGIGAGFVTWVLMKVAAGKGGQVHPALYAIAAAFLLYFLRWALFDATF